MGTLTIRNLDDAVKQKLRERAAARGVSMEQEARDVLSNAMERPVRKKPSIDEILALGVKPPEPIDQKKLTDEMWDEGLL